MATGTSGCSEEVSFDLNFGHNFCMIHNYTFTKIRYHNINLETHGTIPLVCQINPLGKQKQHVASRD